MDDEDGDEGHIGREPDLVEAAVGVPGPDDAVLVKVPASSNKHLLSVPHHSSSEAESHGCGWLCRHHTTSGNGAKEPSMGALVRTTPP